MTTRSVYRGSLRKALITGASSGIGAAIAGELASHGIHVLLSARRQEKLEAVADLVQAAGGEASVHPADLSTEADRQQLYAHIVDEHGIPDILVNNAGLGWYGYYSTMPWQTTLELIQVNILATAQLTRLFLPGMLSKNKGHIINLGSITGSIPSQGVAIYGATKAFLDSFTTALYREMHNTKVRISVVRAGPVKSEFFQQVARRSNGLHIPVERFAIPANRVAKKVWNLIRRPRRVVYVPWFYQLTPGLEQLFGWLIDRLGPLLLRWQRSPNR